MSRYPNIDKDDLASGQTVNIEVKLEREDEVTGLVIAPFFLPRGRKAGGSCRRPSSSSTSTLEGRGKKGRRGQHLQLPRHGVDGPGRRRQPHLRLQGDEDSQTEQEARAAEWGQLWHLLAVLH